ncbi:PD-(D/E)XK nuclease family protein [Vulcanisaeta sp. JCM 14467]
MDSIDLRQLEEVVERAVKRAIEEARSEDMRAMADAIKALADYVRVSFQEFSKGFEEVNRRLEAHERLLEELTRSVGELKVAMGSLGRRWGRDLERTVLELYRHALEERGIEPGKVERFVYTDVDGRYYRPGARLEIGVYIHDNKTYLIEVKSHAELEDVEWLFDKARIVERILSRRADRVLMVAVNIDKDALERARQLGIDVIYGSVIE